MRVTNTMGCAQTHQTEYVSHLHSDVCTHLHIHGWVRLQVPATDAVVIAMVYAAPQNARERTVPRAAAVAWMRLFQPTVGRCAAETTARPAVKPCVAGSTARASNVRAIVMEKTVGRDARACTVHPIVTVATVGLFVAVKNVQGAVPGKTAHMVARGRSVDAAPILMPHRPLPQRHRVLVPSASGAHQFRPHQRHQRHSLRCRQPAPPRSCTPKCYHQAAVEQPAVVLEPTFPFSLLQQLPNARAIAPLRLTQRVLGLRFRARPEATSTASFTPAQTILRTPSVRAGASD